jgi:Flp pilus assembly pilin Flp
MNDADRTLTCLEERHAEEGQTLVEYTMIIVLVIIATLATLAIFQDAVIHGLWGATSPIVRALGGS